ncbi:MAG: PEP-CTERM system TPR-repeat protein PrsT [Deltaproteobacteria bacterium HGW-Deltaproteobacteria-23]|nr:MAG: PEP-CTERM system TPR-repeat protein PrsT [Deltaproteobacteria bacterium HGW-Deltaproteobacteria-23]
MNATTQRNSSSYIIGGVGLKLFKILFIAFTLCAIGCSSATKEELVARGVKELDKSDPGAAIIYFKNALEKDEGYFDARYQLARAYVAAVKYEQAEKEYKKLLEQQPGRRDLKLELARVYNLTGRPEIAISAAQELVSLYGESVDALELLGIAYAINNQPEEAESNLRKTLQQDPSRISASLQLAALMISLGRQSEAREMLAAVFRAEPKNTRAYYLLADLENSLKNRDQSIAIYRKIYELQNTDSLALYKAGILHIEKGDFASAESSAAELIKLFPKRGEGHRLRGIVYYYRKNYQEAIVELQQSIKLQPHIEGFYFLGLSLYERGELENALSKFNIILAAKPSYARARLLSGIILLRQNRIDAAIAQMEKLVGQAPGFAMARNILGSTYMAKGMYDEGMKEFNKAIELDPKLVDVYLKKGIYYLNRGQDRAAETDLQTAVKIAPEVVNTRMLLASHYIRQKQFPKAMLLLQEGLVGGKADAALYNYMAAITRFQKKEKESLGYMQKAKASDPDFYAAYFNLALHHAAVGRHEAALDEFRQLLERDPRNIKALLNIASLLEVTGRVAEADKQYETALASGNEAAYLAYSHFLLKRKEIARAEKILNRGSEVLPRNPAILEAKGRVLMGEKRYYEAIKVFDDLESSSPDSGLPLKIRAYLLMGKPDRAEELAREIISLRPASAYGYMILASVYESRNDLGRAIAEIKKGLQVDSKNTQAYLVIGNLHAKNRDTAAAMAAFQEALRINPDFAPAVFAQGVLLESLGDRHGAMKKYQETLTKAENFVPAINNLAYLHVDGYGNIQEGLRLAFSGFRQDWENPAIMDTLGYALLKNGRHNDAQKVLEKSAELMPGNPTVAYHLALAYKAAGARDRALSMLQKALLLGNFPEESQARQLQKELKR